MLEINVGRVRELKGASLAVLLLLALAPQPVSKAWLARSSGYSDKPVKAACDYLLEQGLIVRSHLGWCLATESQEPPEQTAQYAGTATRNNSDPQADFETRQKDETRDISAGRGFSPIWSKPQTRNNSDPQADFETRQKDETRDNSADRGFSPIWSKPQTRNNSDPQADFETRPKDETRDNSAGRGFSPIWSKPQTRNNSGSRGAFLSTAGSGSRNNSADRGFPHIWGNPQARKNSVAPGSLKILSLKDLKELKDFKDFNTTSTAGKNRKNRQPAAGRSDPRIPTTPSDGKNSQVKAEIWAELSRLGLRKNARTEALVELEHVTPAYVRALAEKLEQQGRGGYRHTGLFVKACEQAEDIQPVAEPRQRGRAVQEAVDRFLNRGC